MKQVIEIIGKTLSIDPSRITAESHLVDHLGMKIVTVQDIIDLVK